MVQGPADLPAQQIYEQAIKSVLWITTDSGHGSGVLIDQDRQLAVTNQHVTGNNAWVDVYFPGRDENENLVRDMEYYRNNYRSLERIGYATKGRVIATDSVNDVAIIQLNQLSPIAQEINHDFSISVETSMQRGDKVHILGNPGNRLWNWTQGTYLGAYEDCLLNGGACLEMEGDAEGGNSGGPILNGQGVLIGILTEGTDDTVALASPFRNIKALLDNVGSKHTFRIKNNAGFALRYYIQWSDDRDFERYSLNSGSSRYHWGLQMCYPPSTLKSHLTALWTMVRSRCKSIPWRLSFVTLGTIIVAMLRLLMLRSTFSSTTGETLNWISTLMEVLQLLCFPQDQGLMEQKNVQRKQRCCPTTQIRSIRRRGSPINSPRQRRFTVTIYAIDGNLIRTLTLGHQSAGTYQSKSRAAYWDGKNEVGEPVVSGVYFYTLTADDFSATRKMLTRK